MSDPRPGAQQPGDPSGSVENVSDDLDPTIAFQASTRDVQPAATGLSSAHQAAVDALPAGSALLVVRHGPTAGARFLLAADRVTAGRHPSSDIFLDDVTVSRQHAEFLRQHGGFVLRDVGSLNGTYLGQDRIDEAVLRDGDEGRIGKFRMVYYASRRNATTAQRPDRD